MTMPPEGWSAPGGEPPTDPSQAPPPQSAPQPPPYGAPPPGYGPPGYPPPPMYGAPPGWAPPPGWYGGPAGWGTPPGLTPGVVPLRPLTVGELLDGAVKVIRRYPKPTLGMSALVTIVVTILNVLSVLSSDTSSFDNVSSTSSDGSTSSGTQVLTTVTTGLGAALGGLVLTGALVVVVGKAVLGHQTTMGEVWAQVRTRLLALLGLVILTSLVSFLPVAVGIGLAVAFAAGVDPTTLVIGVPLAVGGLVATIYLYTRLSLAPAVLVLEKAGIRTAMRRSGELVRGSWWRVFGILALAALIASIVTGILAIPIDLIGGVSFFTNPSSHSAKVLTLSSALGNGVARWLVAPFSSGVAALLYVDRRMRAEGLDLTLQAAARR